MSRILRVIAIGLSLCLAACAGPVAVGAPLPGATADQTAVLATAGACDGPPLGGDHAPLEDTLLRPNGWIRVSSDDVDGLASLDTDDDPAGYTLPGSVGVPLAGAAVESVRLSDRQLLRASAAAQHGADLLIGAKNDGLAAVNITDDAGSLGWVSPCSFEVYTSPFYGYWAQQADHSTPFNAFLAIVEGDGDAEAALKNALYGEDADVQWADLPPDRRLLDVEQTPPDVLDALELLSLRYDVPPAWYALPITLCSRTPLGWNGCIDPAVGVTGELRVEAYVDPQATLDIVALGPDGDITRPLVELQTIDLSRHDVSGDRELLLTADVSVATVGELEAQISAGDGELFTPSDRALGDE